MLEKIEAELLWIEQQQEEHERLVSEVAHSKAATAAQAEELASLYEAEARRLAGAASSGDAAAAPFNSPHKAIGAAMNLADERAREAEMCKALRAELLGLDGTRPFVQARG